MVETAFTTTSGFRALYETEYGFVWSAVRRFGVPGALLEDAVQDTFIVAYRRRRSFAPGPTRPWLYGIARGVASNYRRTARRVARKREALADTVGPVAAHSGATQASLRALDAFLANLSSEDRELFVLSEIEGLTGPELSSALQLKTRTVYRRLDRLRDRFAEQAIDQRSLSPRRPRASAASWATLLPVLQSNTLGWLGLGAALPKLAAAAGLVGTISIGWAIARAETPKAAQPLVAGAFVQPPPAPEPPQPAAPAPRSSPRHPDPHPTTAPALPPAPRKATPLGSQDEDTQHEVEEVDPLTRENALLRQAKSAIAKRDFEAALAATTHHATEFPDSPMADLRTALRVEALCGSGKERQGRGEALSFIRDNPDAPMVEKIRAACLTKTPSAGQGPQ